jgi:hypothetical protein
MSSREMVKARPQRRAPAPDLAVTIPRRRSAPLMGFMADARWANGGAASQPQQTPLKDGGGGRNGSLSLTEGDGIVHPPSPPLLPVGQCLRTWWGTASTVCAPTTLWQPVPSSFAAFTATRRATKIGHASGHAPQTLFPCRANTVLRS